MARRPERPIIKVTLWQMVGDLLIHVTNKGQILPFVFGVVLIVIASRMPSEELGKLAEVLLAWRTGVCVGGYVLALLVAFVWFWHVRFERRLHKGEIDRLAEERTFWQQIAMDQKMRSSKSDSSDEKEA